MSKNNKTFGTGPVKIAIKNDLEAIEYLSNYNFDEHYKNIQIHFIDILSEDAVEEIIKNIKRPFSILVDINTTDSINLNGPGVVGVLGLVSEIVKTNRPTNLDWYNEKYELPVTVIGKNNYNWKDYVKKLLDYSNGING